MLNNTIISVEPLLPNEVAKELAANVKMRRLDLDITQEGMAERSGVPLATYRKFERTGEISLKGLLKIASALGSLDEFMNLFTKKQYLSLDEIINEDKIRNRKRGKRR